MALKSEIIWDEIPNIMDQLEQLAAYALTDSAVDRANSEDSPQWQYIYKNKTWYTLFLPLSNDKISSIDLRKLSLCFEEQNECMKIKRLWSSQILHCLSNLYFSKN